MASSVKKMISVEYEVFGKVQGVFFRKHTEKTAKALGLVGWVMNTATGTVVGTVQGPEDKIKKMQDWLKNTGSPKSRIDKCEFRNCQTVTKYDFKDFKVKKELGEKPE